VKVLQAIDNQLSKNDIFEFLVEKFKISRTIIKNYFMYFKSRAYFLILFNLFLAFYIKAQDNVMEEEKDSLKIEIFDQPLKVGIKSSPPFVFKDEKGEWVGISIFLWEQLAEKLKWEYEYIEKESLSPLIKSLENAEVDLSINPLTVTSNRIEKIDFTQPFFIANSVIATEVKTEDKVWNLLGSIFSVEFIQAVLLLLMVVFLGGFFVWWFEHKKNPQFPKGWPGLWAGVWWSAATMTTVGYGDKAPKTIAGQIVGFIWMFAAILMISGFMAGIASALTVEQLDDDWTDINQLREVKVGSVEGSASKIFLTNHFIKSKDYKSSALGLKALANKEIEAFVYDEPILRHEIERDSLSSKLRVLPFRFNTQYYSFGLPKGSPLIDKINPVLLESIEDVGWKAVLSDYDLVEF
jgi:polar amino acid transport system substrate-binding protein